MKKIFIALTVLVVSGCAWVGTHEKINSIDKDEKIDAKSSFYLVYPKNGHERTFMTGELVINEDSAKEVVDVFYKKYHPVLGSLIVSDTNLDLEKAFKEAKLHGDKYMITIDIHEWKDSLYMQCVTSAGKFNTTEDDKKTLDLVDLSIQVYDVKTQALLNKHRIYNSGCPVVFLNVIPVGTMGPEGRLNNSSEKWYKEVFTY